MNFFTIFQLFLPLLLVFVELDEARAFLRKFERFATSTSPSKVCIPMNMVSEIIASNPSPVGIPKARIELSVKGASVNNALFRGEVKKELTFLRGCNAVFKASETDIEVAEIVAEGKTEKIASFLKWLDSLSIDFSMRKPNFIGPR
jgi:hypothetical protein